MVYSLIFPFPTRKNSVALGQIENELCYRMLPLKIKRQRAAKCIFSDEIKTVTMLKIKSLGKDEKLGKRSAIMCLQIRARATARATTQAGRLWEEEGEGWMLPRSWAVVSRCLWREDGGTGCQQVCKCWGRGGTESAIGLKIYTFVSVGRWAAQIQLPHK